MVPTPKAITVNYISNRLNESHRRDLVPNSNQHFLIENLDNLVVWLQYSQEYDDFDDSTSLNVKGMCTFIIFTWGILGATGWTVLPNIMSSPWTRNTIIFLIKHAKLCRNPQTNDVHKTQKKARNVPLVRSNLVILLISVNTNCSNFENIVIWCVENLVI